MFKEIDLSEKQGTGITKILRTLKANGSPAPEFDTVEERVYLSTVIRMHEGFDVPQNEAINDVINEAINCMICIDYSEKAHSDAVSCRDRRMRYCFPDIIDLVWLTISEQ